MEVNSKNTRSRYAEKLLDQRWLEKRKAIIERDGKRCAYCHRDHDLQVHHIKYTGEPWEAPDDDLITVCERCHVFIEEYKESFRNKRITLLSVEPLEFSNGLIIHSYYLVLLESPSGTKITVIYEYKDKAARIVFWGELWEIADIVNKFKKM